MIRLVISREIVEDFDAMFEKSRENVADLSNDKSRDTTLLRFLQ